MVRPAEFVVSTTSDFRRLALVDMGQEDVVKRSLLGGDFAEKFSSVKRTAPFEIPSRSKEEVLVKAWSLSRPKIEYELGDCRCSGIARMEKTRDPSVLLLAKRMELLPSSLKPGR